jgi:ATP-binding protein involved in chromosome partitioning
MITSQDVLKVLGTVQEPELHRDIVSLKMVNDIEVQNEKIKLKLTLTTPVCQLRGKIENDIKQAILGNRSFILSQKLKQPKHW